MNAEEVVAIYSEVKDLEIAGARLIEMELVPVEVAVFETRNTSLIAEGKGFGSVCDIQYLISCDVLGNLGGRNSLHSKTFADLAT